MVTRLTRCCLYLQGGLLHQCTVRAISLHHERVLAVSASLALSQDRVALQPRWHIGSRPSQELKLWLLRSTLCRGALLQGPNATHPSKRKHMHRVHPWLTLLSTQQRTAWPGNTCPLPASRSPMQHHCCHLQNPRPVAWSIRDPRAVASGIRDPRPVAPGTKRRRSQLVLSHLLREPQAVSGRTCTSSAVVRSFSSGAGNAATLAR